MRGASALLMIPFTPRLDRGKFLPNVGFDTDSQHSLCFESPAEEICVYCSRIVLARPYSIVGSQPAHIY